MANGIQIRGVWLYKLSDPFGNTPYLPVDSHQLADLLNISERTALRICKGESTLRPCEITYLQVRLFGLIPDPDFIRQRLAFKKGKLISLNDDSFEIPAGEITEYVLLARTHKLWVTQLAEDLKAAKVRIEELTSPPLANNIIDFKLATSKRKGRPTDDMGA